MKMKNLQMLGKPMKTTLYLLQLPTELHEQLRKFAFDKRKPKAAVIREALLFYLKLHGTTSQENKLNTGH